MVVIHYAIKGTVQMACGITQYSRRTSDVSGTYNKDLVTCKRCLSKLEKMEAHEKKEAYKSRGSKPGNMLYLIGRRIRHIY